MDRNCSIESFQVTKKAGRNDRLLLCLILSPLTRLRVSIDWRYDPDFQFWLDLLMQVNFDRVQAKLLQDTFEADLIVG